MANPASLPIFLGKPSPEGPRYLATSFVYPSQPSTPKLIDCSQSGMSSVQSAFIDNTLNGVALTLQVQDTNQSIVIPAYTSVITPIYTGNLQFAFNIIANLNTLPAQVVVKLFNFPQNFSQSSPISAPPLTALASNQTFNVPTMFSSPVALKTIVTAGNYSILSYDATIIPPSITNDNTQTYALISGSVQLATMLYPSRQLSGVALPPLQFANVVFPQPYVLPRNTAITLWLLSGTAANTGETGYVDIYGYVLP